MGDSWGKSSGIDPSAAAAVLGFIGFSIAIGTILLLEKGAKQSDRYKPVVIRIKKSGNGALEETCKTRG